MLSHREKYLLYYAAERADASSGEEEETMRKKVGSMSHNLYKKCIKVLLLKTA